MAAINHAHPGASRRARVNDVGPARRGPLFIFVYLYVRIFFVFFFFFARRFRFAHNNARTPTENVITRRARFRDFRSSATRSKRPPSTSPTRSRGETMTTRLEVVCVGRAIVAEPIPDDSFRVARVRANNKKKKKNNTIRNTTE